MLLLPLMLHAQVVNAQPLVATADGGKRNEVLAWTLEAGIDARRGNTRLFSVTLSAEGFVQDDRDAFRSAGSSTRSITTQKPHWA